MSDEERVLAAIHKFGPRVRNADLVVDMEEAIEREMGHPATVEWCAGIWLVRLHTPAGIRRFGIQATSLAQFI